MEGATEPKMFGHYVPVLAEVVVDHRFSVHADATELLSWLQALPTAPKPSTSFTVNPSQLVPWPPGFERRPAGAVVPTLGERVRVD